MKAVIRIMQVLLTAVWLCLLALSALLYLSSRGSGLTGISQWGGFVVTGDSMAPELKDGDLAVIHMGAVPKGGDVVFCKDGAGMPELTRIIGTSEGQPILNPDGREDSRLATAGEIEGVFVGYLPGFGEPFRFLCSLPGVIVIFAAGLMLIVLPGFMLRAPRNSRPERPRRATSQGGYTPRH